MARKMMDCRDTPSQMNCSIVISGEEEEVIRAATEHAVSVHGEHDTAELRKQIRESLKDEPMEFQRMGRPTQRGRESTQPSTSFS